MVIDTISQSRPPKPNLFMNMHAHNMKLSFHIDKRSCQLSSYITILIYTKWYTVAHKAEISFFLDAILFLLLIIFDQSFVNISFT